MLGGMAPELCFPMAECSKSITPGSRASTRPSISTRSTARARSSPDHFRPRLGAAPQMAPNLYGWALKLQLTTTGAGTTPHVILDHCTIDEAGLADLTENSTPSTVRIEVKHCAIRAETVVACRSAAALVSQFNWRGDSNQYDIFGPSWIVVSTKERLPAPSGAPTDLGGWLQLVNTDRNPIRSRLKFWTDPLARSAEAQPSEFLVEAASSLAAKAGADPALVGPHGER